MGLAQLGAPVAPGAGVHLLAIGAMGLSILAVLCIAGRTHAGYALDERPWVGAAAVLVALSALLRAASGLPDMPVGALQLIAGLGWVAAFALAAGRLGVLFVRPRVDGRGGCAEYEAPASGTPRAGA